MPLKHFRNLGDAGAGAVRAMLAEAHRRKAARRGWPQGAPDADAPLAGRVLAAIFEKPSTRTRLSFEMAMRQLGGHALTLAAADLQLGRGETVADTARVLSRFVDGVMLRCHAHADLEAFAAAAQVPVINGLTDLSHPCQAVADMMTVEERLGKPVAGTRWAWVGDGNNVAHSLVEAAGLMGFALCLAVPEGYEPDPGFLATARARGADVRVVRDPDLAVAGADVVATDTWVSMGQTESEARIRALTPYQVNPLLMARAAPGAVFLHCLPAQRGREVTDSVLDGPQSAVLDEAENRVHAQKAILLWLFDRL
ncbi:MAG: ornithine carbamoyltransferase [Sphingomonadaceae bacterium]|uniref:ornithine carbamoyltransferase n=1 Tax=Thermaurantiacus sp. TaxID=2820283 RepID=UPI00298F0556|nr:ornithine carbamoyltransferase [Thermaurantiacus sp.]MCS6986869.1 ornithine carbamoyltransferase [Sphingomonadaceae bacterium]